MLRAFQSSGKSTFACTLFRFFQIHDTFPGSFPAYLNKGVLEMDVPKRNGGKKMIGRIGRTAGLPDFETAKTEQQEKQKTTSQRGISSMPDVFENAASDKSAATELFSPTPWKPDSAEPAGENEQQKFISPGVIQAELDIVAAVAIPSLLRSRMSANEASEAGALKTIASSQIGQEDTDQDGLFDIQEDLLGTDPNNPDTDGDGIIDSLDPHPLGP